jgi:hypothetical protein
VKVCKEFNWEPDGRDMEKARREATAVDATGRRARAFRAALCNTWRCMMAGRVWKGLTKRSSSSGNKWACDSTKQVVKGRQLRTEPYWWDRRKDQETSGMHGRKRAESELNPS